MGLAYSKNNGFYVRQYNELTSQQKIDKAERRLKDKKNQLEDIQNELRLLELDAYEIYKKEIIYITFMPNIIKQADKWLEMINDKNVKIDKRKKYKEKDMFEYLTRDLREVFNQPDIEIVSFMQRGYNHSADLIDFTCQGHKFTLSLPIVQNISLKEYQDEGAYVFKIRLHHYDSENIWGFIGDTFEECDLKDMLADYLVKVEQENG